MILEDSIFNNDFILNSLIFFKNRKEISDKKLKEIIMKEKKKIDINAGDQVEGSLLHIAFKNKNRDIIGLLVDYRADIDIEDIKGNSLLFYLFNDNYRWVIWKW